MSGTEPGALPLEPGVSEVLLAAISSEPISTADFERQVGADAYGAVVAFSGVVRDHDGGRGVTALSYSSHPRAAAVIGELAGRIGAQFPGVRIAVAHRIGDLQVGDTALACAVAAAHRREAFSACQELVELVKSELPIWKEQAFTDGGSEWVGI